MTELELMATKGNARQATIKDYDRQKSILDLQVKIHEQNIALLRNQMSQAISEKNNAIAKDAQEKEQDQTYKNKIQKKYGLKNNWGFHPETGELIDE